MKVKTEIKSEDKSEDKSEADFIKAEHTPSLNDKGVFFPSVQEQLLTGFTPASVKNIYDNIKIGMLLPDCAKLLRLPPERLKKWYTSNYCNFQVIIDEALATNKRIHVGRISLANNALHIKASTWLLERKHKEEYSKEITINVNHNVVMQAVTVFTDVLTKYILDPDILLQAGEEMRSKFALMSPQTEDIEHTVTEDNTHHENN